MYEIDKTKFGAFISELRKEKGMTQKELAVRLYISDKAVSKWETGHSIPDITLLVPLSDQLGVTVTELLECRRIEHADTLDMEHADDLVRKVIGISEEEALGRPRLKRKHVFFYAGCVFAAAGEAALLYFMRDKLEMQMFPDLFPLFMMLGMMLFFGIYFWFFIREKLPSYYDEHKINVYADGMLHMNLPGVYFNNRNWPHMVKALRMWSSVGAIILPILYVIFSIGCSAWRPWSDLIIILVLFLGSLFLPLYLVGRKYQRPEGEPVHGRAILVFISIVIAALLLVGSMGTFRSALRMGCVEYADRDSWSAKYRYLDGVMKRNLWSEDGDGGFSIAVETETGNITIEIEDETGAIVFCEENMKTGSYEAEAFGKCVVRVIAEAHKGCFQIED